MPDPVEGEEVVPGEETPPEETHEGFVSDKQHAERIGVQHKKYRDEERGRVVAEERASTVERELEELKAKQAEVIIPPVPEQDSDSFAEDMRKRDEAIVAKADLDAETQQIANERTKKDEARVAKQDAAKREKVAAFDTNMVTHGLNPAETSKAAKAVIDYGISETFEDILLEDPDGPLFVAYLSQNPIELEKLNEMSPLQLVNHLNGDIRAKASLLKPQTSTAPDPPITPSGGGAPESKEDWERGAKYE